MKTVTAPSVSVLMITFNHGLFIEKAISSIVTQKGVNFELVIGEDGSTDNTRAICEKYAREYPEIVRLLPAEGNKGMMRNFIHTLNNCRGKYIAICEGDDFWTSDQKLSIQYDLLEENPRCNLTFHLCDEVNELDGKITNTEYFKNEQYGFKDFATKGCFIHTCSVMVRNLPEVVNSFDDWCTGLSGADFLLYLLCTSHNKQAIALNKVMGVYRTHLSGSWSGLSPLRRVEVLERDLELYLENLDLSRQEILLLKFQQKRVVLGYLKYIMERSGSPAIFQRLTTAFFNRVYFGLGAGHVTNVLGDLIRPGLRKRVETIKNRVNAKA
jgi:glycosyltransferase involved in cell wall biosynthesis